VLGYGHATAESVVTAINAAKDESGLVNPSEFNALAKRLKIPHDNWSDFTTQIGRFYSQFLV
jgi:hypothetical protein